MELYNTLILQKAMYQECNTNEKATPSTASGIQNQEVGGRIPGTYAYL